MQIYQMQGPLGVVTAAVTPVVMISATAILIGAANSRHSSLSDRVRALTAEHRAESTSSARRENIVEQIGLFRRRLAYIQRAHMALHIATACFIAMVMVIGLTGVRQTLASATLPFLSLGVLLLFVAVLLEVVELEMANRTIELEVRDVQSRGAD